MAPRSTVLTWPNGQRSHRAGGRKLLSSRLVGLWQHTAMRYQWQTSQSCSSSIQWWHSSTRIWIKGNFPPGRQETALRATAIVASIRVLVSAPETVYRFINSSANTSTARQMSGCLSSFRVRMNSQFNQAEHSHEELGAGESSRDERVCDDAQREVGCCSPRIGIERLVQAHCYMTSKSICNPCKNADLRLAPPSPLWGGSL